MSKLLQALYCGDYVGVVEDIMDPEESGRVRVRIFGVHSDDTSAIPTEALPWCTIAVHSTNPFLSGIGMTPLGLLVGSMVRIQPIDPDDLQEWEVQSVIAGRRTRVPGGAGYNPPGIYPNADSDVNPLARGKVTSSTQYADKAANAQSHDVDGDTNQNKTAVDPATFAKAPWMDAAKSQLGVNETTSPNQIRTYATHGGGVSTYGGRIPWCACFVGWCLGQAGVQGSGSPVARSYGRYGDDVLNQPTIPYGSIGIIAGSRGANSGHVFFITSDDGNYVGMLGGNQSSHSKDNGGEVTNSRIHKSKLLYARFPTATNAKKA